MMSEDPKLQTILASAWTAFSAYGFRKTSMDDIARGAGMSRPALYLHFRNKEAILGALVAAYYAYAEKAVAAALAAGGTPQDSLKLAFQAQGGPLMEAMMGSAHGMELFEAGASVASEAICTGEAALRTAYSGWLAEGAAAGTLAPAAGPAGTARVICAALKGVKHSAADFGDYQAAVADLAELMGRAITPA